MAGALRLTKAEREYVERKINSYDNAKEEKLRDSIHAKLVKLEAPKVSSGVTTRTAVAAFQGVLGSRLTLPPEGARGVWAQMQNRLNMLGLTVGDCTTIAKVADAQWTQGRIKAESLVRQAENLLADAQLPLPMSTPSRGKAPDLEEL